MLNAWILADMFAAFVSQRIACVKQQAKGTAYNSWQPLTHVSLQNKEPHSTLQQESNA